MAYVKAQATHIALLSCTQELAGIVGRLSVLQISSAREKETSNAIASENLSIKDLLIWHPNNLVRNGSGFNSLPISDRVQS